MSFVVPSLRSGYYSAFRFLNPIDTSKTVSNYYLIVLTTCMHARAHIHTHLHRLHELCLYMRLVLKEESHVLNNGDRFGLFSCQVLIEMEHLRNGEVQQLLVLISQLGHFFLPQEEKLSTVTHLSDKNRQCYKHCVYSVTNISTRNTQA